MKMRNSVSFKLLVFTTAIIILGKANQNLPFYAEKFFEQRKDYQCVDILKSFSVHYLSKCALLCQQDISCYGFNYEKSIGSCELVEDWAIHDVVPAKGWSIYQKAPKNYVQVGMHSISISTAYRTKAVAASACEPIGRLVKIDTVEKFYTITAYLESLAQFSLMDVWTDGHYDSQDNSWKFADGSPLPNNTAMLHISSNYQTCIRLNYKSAEGMYKLRDMGCFRAYRYMYYKYEETVTEPTISRLLCSGRKVIPS